MTLGRNGFRFVHALHVNKLTNRLAVYLTIEVGHTFFPFVSSPQPIVGPAFQSEECLVRRRRLRRRNSPTGRGLVVVVRH